MRGASCFIRHLELTAACGGAGDVVMSRSPRNPKHIVCKRVLGLAGDTVHVPRTGMRGPVSVQVLVPLPPTLRSIT